MGKDFKYYITVWSLFFVIYNVVLFALPNEVAGMSKYGGAFWAGYVFIILAFAGQLLCAYFAFKSENAEKVFLHLPLVTISYSTLITSMILGTACIIIPNLPNWIGIIVCVLVLGINAISVIGAKTAAEMVIRVQENTQLKVAFIKALVADTEALKNRASSLEARKAIQKVYEVARYSDPVSHDTLDSLESRIIACFHNFSDAVIQDGSNMETLADEMVTLLNDRNKKCKLLKQR